MKTARWAAVLLALLALAAPAIASPVPRRCSAPRPELQEYSSREIVVGLTVDYSACRWWHGDEIELVGEMKRVVPGVAPSGGASAMTTCLTLVQAGGERARSWEPKSCSIDLGMPHKALEMATYSGRFEFPWRNGVKEVAFSYNCSSTPVRTTCE